MVPPEKVRSKLLERRKLLVDSINLAPSNTNLSQLLEQVDAALGRISAGTYGTCEICSRPIEDERLDTDPLIRTCSSDTPRLAREEFVRVLRDRLLAFILLRITNDARDLGELLRAAALVPLPFPKAEPSLPPGLGVVSFSMDPLEMLRAAWRVFKGEEADEENLIDHKKQTLDDSSRAHQLQSMLLPKPGFRVSEWETYYDYAPAGAVGETTVI